MHIFQLIPFLLSPAGKVSQHMIFKKAPPPDLNDRPPTRFPGLLFKTYKSFGLCLPFLYHQKSFYMVIYTPLSGQSLYLKAKYIEFITSK